jgi:formylglycine-generating enzyme required for sulfatase activity
MKKANLIKLIGLLLVALMSHSNAEPPDIMVDTMIMDERFVIFYLTNLEAEDFQCDYIRVKATVKDSSGNLVGRRNIIVRNVTLTAGSLESKMEAGKEMIKRFENQYDQPRIVTISEAKFRCKPTKPTDTPMTENGNVFQDRLKDGSLGPEMVLIPAGSFRMGDIQGSGESDEQPVHQVSVNKFAMGKYEVSFAEYDKFAEDTGRKKPDDEGWGRGNRPVINVSWHDATAYAKWLSNQTGKLYRLPTEAEWEYAARAGTETKYWWGNDSNQACSYANVHDNTSKEKNGFLWTHHKCTDDYAQTAPVGSFQPNEFGLSDMLGNVWEWTCSEYEDKYKGKEKECINHNSNKNLVLRGGSWFNSPWYLRTAFRRRYTPDHRHDYNGFRVVMLRAAWTK